MNKARLSFLLAALLVSTLPCLAVRASHADVKDLGDVCIDIAYDGLARPPVTLTFGILAYGASQQHILLTAALGPAAAHGAASLNGDTVIITFTNSDVSGDFSATSTTHITLNASTLRGRLTTMTTQVSPTPGSSKSTGNATIVPCQ